MFSSEEKRFIAAEVERTLLSLGHPEMLKKNPKFKLHVDGAEGWSWADIEPNWVFDEAHKPGVNPWNQNVRDASGRESLP